MIQSLSFNISYYWRCSHLFISPILIMYFFVSIIILNIARSVFGTLIWKSAVFIKPEDNRKNSYFCMLKLKSTLCIVFECLLFWAYALITECKGSKGEQHAGVLQGQTMVRYHMIFFLKRIICYLSYFVYIF